MKIKIGCKWREPKLRERHLFIGLVAFAISISMVLTNIISDTIVRTDRGYVFQRPVSEPLTINFNATDETYERVELHDVNKPPVSDGVFYDELLKSIEDGKQSMMKDSGALNEKLEAYKLINELHVKTLSEWDASVPKIIIDGDNYEPLIDRIKRRQ